MVKNMIAYICICTVSAEAHAEHKVYRTEHLNTLSAHFSCHILNNCIFISQGRSEWKAYIIVPSW